MKNLKIASCLIAFISLPVNSATVNIVDNGYFTTDLISKLDWLDVTQTRSLSYEQVLTKIQNNGSLSGWRFATVSELDGLIYHYTNVIPDRSLPENTITSNYQSSTINALVSLLGDTLEDYWISEYGVSYNAWNSFPDGTGYGFTFGIIKDYGNIYTGLLNYSTIPLPEGYLNNYGFYNATYRKTLSNYKDSSVGSFLIRDSIIATAPEPSTLFLCIIGFIGLVKTKLRNIL